jgi:hypothetical protein
LSVLPQCDGNQECKRRYGNYDYEKAKGAFSLSRSRPPAFRFLKTRFGVRITTDCHFRIIW